MFTIINFKPERNGFKILKWNLEFFNYNLFAIFANNYKIIMLKNILRAKTTTNHILVTN